MALSRGGAFCPVAPLLLRSLPAKEKAKAKVKGRARAWPRRYLTPVASAVPSSSSSSDSSSFSSSSVAQLASSGAVLLRKPSQSSGLCSGAEETSGSGPPPQVDVVVLGVDHGDPDPLLGSFVLSAGPAAVVVETALCERHGEETGTCLSLSGGGSSLGFGGGGAARWETKDGDEIAATSAFGDGNSGSSGGGGGSGGGEEEPHVAQCLSLAERLSSLPDGSPEKTAFWKALSQHLAGEQLAYVAALSKGARLVFGDRPKRETVRRLAERLSAADLDAAVAAQASRNTLESLTKSVAPPPPLGGGNFGRAYDVLVRERDAAICSVVAAEVEREMTRTRRGRETDDGVDDDASSSASASTSFPSPSVSSGPPRPIVVVVGKWHLEGVRSLWESGEWRKVLEEEEEEGGEADSEEGARASGSDRGSSLSPPPSSSSSSSSPPAARRRHPSLSAAEDLGLRRALVDELLMATATAGSAEEVDPGAFGADFTKGAATEEDGEEEEAQARRAFALTRELYGTARMQLALLDSRAEFDAVVSGWKCDFWEVVEPVRSVRAANGGKGFDEDLVMSLRGLNFIFEEV